MNISETFIYCKGIGCPLRDRCLHYTEGQSLPEGDWKWQNDCGEDHRDFLPVTPSNHKKSVRYEKYIVQDC